MKEGTGVLIYSKEEFCEFLKISKPHAWGGEDRIKPDLLSRMTFTYPFRVSTDKQWGWNNKEYWSNEITLAEFKKEQGIMKYKAGDVVTNGCYARKILGVCGLVYFVSRPRDIDQFAGTFTEAQLDSDGYHLETETTKTDMSVSEIEKALGKAAGSLNVVAE